MVKLEMGLDQEAMQAAEAMFDGVFSTFSNDLSHGDAALGRRVQ